MPINIFGHSEMVERAYFVPVDMLLFVLCHVATKTVLGLIVAYLEEATLKFSFLYPLLVGLKENLTPPESAFNPLYTVDSTLCNGYFSKQCRLRSDAACGI